MSTYVLRDVHSYISEIIRKKKLIVQKSWLGDFSGLFAIDMIEEGEIVCIYVGKRYNTKEAFRLDPLEKDYLMRLGEQVYVDAKYCPHVIARYINDCRNSLGYNVRFDKQPEFGWALIIATKKIFPGQEIFVDYGKWYWYGKVSRKLSLLEWKRLTS